MFTPPDAHSRSAHRTAEDPPATTALVQGAGRGIGLAIVETLLRSGRLEKLYATCREPQRAERLQTLAADDNRLCLRQLDVTNEDSIRRVAQFVAGDTGNLDLLINCAGILHEPGLVKPERRLQDIDRLAMLRSFEVNALGALLVLREFEVLLKRSAAARVMTLSARVGSIEDNRLGGWFGYRASKAALNQVIRTAAIEWGRLPRPILCVAMHPGTVDTELSRPFSSRARTIFPPMLAAEQLLGVLHGLGIEDSGGFFAWDGSRIPW